MLEKNKWMRVGKIAVGCTVSFLLAQTCGLNFPSSAGIITLLTIQDTKKETLKLSMQRAMSFVLTICMCFVVFKLVGLHWVAFGIVIFVVVAFVFAFQWEGTLSVNAVICTHLISIKNVDIPSIFNEFGLLVIGTAAAILLNLVVFSEKKDIRHDILKIEKQLQLVVRDLAQNLGSFNQTASVTYDIDLLESFLSHAMKRALENADNTFNKAASYYMEYMEMRYSQCSVLRDFQSSLRSMTCRPRQAELIIPFMERLADSLHEQNNMGELLEDLDEIFGEMKRQPLPESRNEFENRAVLYHLMLELKEFLKIKKHFCDELTEDEIKRYWGTQDVEPK